LAIALAFPSSAFAAKLPNQGSNDHTSCWSGVNNVITFSKTHTASSYEMQAHPSGGMFDKNTFRCVGMNAALEHFLAASCSIGHHLSPAAESSG
jgi:hypothetical protein